MKDKAKQVNRLSRRKVLKGAAATAGLAAGAQVIGAPTIWAQNIRDITLNHTGMSYSVLIDIARQATEDLGFTVEMSISTDDDITVFDSTGIALQDSATVPLEYERAVAAGVGIEKKMIST